MNVAIDHLEATRTPRGGSRAAERIHREQGGPPNSLGLDSARLGAAGLSPREIEVLELVARGLINDAIGLELAISPRTVQKHLERVHAKLGVGTRMAAVAHAHMLSARWDHQVLR